MPNGNRWCYAADHSSDSSRVASLAHKPSSLDYISMKAWGINLEEYSFSSGEAGRLGQHVPERYLGDRTDLKGTRLKMVSRLGCLPLMNRVGRETRPPWPREYRTCALCCSAKIEDVHHFVMECPRYEAKRIGLLRQVVGILAQSTGNATAIDFAGMPTRDQLAVLLGKIISDPAAEDKIDRNVKRFLSKCWNLRSKVTRAVHDALFTSYGIYSAPGA